VYAGWTVPVDYDPLLAKLIGYGQDRQQAIARLTRALPEYFVEGIKTNLGLFRRILADENFRSGKIDTGYLERLLKAEAGSDGGEARKRTANIAAIAAAVFTLLDSTSTAAGNGALSNHGTGTTRAGPETSSWKRAARTEGLT
jgi:acetyl-CoA carboxylase, biotin carboxylase subunit